MLLIGTNGLQKGVCQKCHQYDPHIQSTSAIILSAPEPPSGNDIVRSSAATVFGTKSYTVQFHNPITAQDVHERRVPLFCVRAPSITQAYHICLCRVVVVDCIIFYVLYVNIWHSSGTFIVCVGTSKRTAGDHWSNKACGRCGPYVAQRFVLRCATTVGPSFVQIQFETTPRAVVCCLRIPDASKTYLGAALTCGPILAS